MFHFFIIFVELGEMVLEGTTKFRFTDHLFKISKFQGASHILQCQNIPMLTLDHTTKVSQTD